MVVDSDSLEVTVWTIDGKNYHFAPAAFLFNTLRCLIVSEGDASFEWATYWRLNVSYLLKLFVCDNLSILACQNVMILSFRICLCMNV